MKTIKDVETLLGGDYLNHKIHTAVELVNIALYGLYEREEIQEAIISGGLDPEKAYLINEKEREDYRFLSKEEILNLSEKKRKDYLEDSLANIIWGRWNTNSLVWPIYQGVFNAESDSIDPDIRSQRAWLLRSEDIDGEWANYLSEIPIDKYLAYYDYFINDLYFSENQEEKTSIIEDCFLLAKACPAEILKVFALGFSQSITNKTFLHPNCPQTLKVAITLSRMNVT